MFPHFIKNLQQAVSLPANGTFVRFSCVKLRSDATKESAESKKTDAEFEALRDQTLVVLFSDGDGDTGFIAQPVNESAELSVCKSDALELMASDMTFVNPVKKLVQQAIVAGFLGTVIQERTSSQFVKFKPDIKVGTKKRGVTFTDDMKSLVGESLVSLAIDAETELPIVLVNSELGIKPNKVHPSWIQMHVPQKIDNFTLGIVNDIKTIVDYCQLQNYVTLSEEQHTMGKILQAIARLD